MDEKEIANWLLDVTHEVLGRSGRLPKLSDNFVELGGNSIGAIMLSAAVEERFAIIVDIMTIFDRNLGAVLSAIVDPDGKA